MFVWEYDMRYVENVNFEMVIKYLMEDILDKNYWELLMEGLELLLDFKWLILLIGK